MTFTASKEPLARELDVAVSVASEAAELLLELRVRLHTGAVAADDLRREADLRSHELICSRLATAFPDDPILSEEGDDDSRRLSSRRVWIVDPLDGTREFGEPDRRDWAVHLALVVDGVPVVGVVALPAEGRVVVSKHREPAAAAEPPRIVVSRTRPAREAEELREALGGVLLPLGSAGVKAVSVVEGRAEVYVHSGGQYEWDSAAPAAVALAAGLHVSRVDGSPLVYNQAPPLLPDLLICHPGLARLTLELLALSTPPQTVV